jgi:dienelactone hydrolase
LFHKSLSNYIKQDFASHPGPSSLKRGWGAVIINAKISFLVILLQFFFTNTFSQKQFNCLDWKSDVTVNTFLVQKMHEQYNERKKEFEEAIASKTLTKEYIQRIQKKFATLLGRFPSKTSLNPIITGTLQREGYRIEKIIYESFSNHHVTANLYIPNGKGPFPAALLFCGHENESKATVSYQKTATLFAKNGFVVLVIDPISQSERFQLIDAKGRQLTRGGTTEHTLLNEESNLLGASTSADELWDNVRGLDYLITRPEVDTSKIGCLGNSGGGMQTIYFAGFEKRVKLFAPCSYLANRERTLEISGPADGCAQIPGEGKEHFELSDYLIAAAPKPILVLAGRYDFIDYTGTFLAYNDLKKIYTSLHLSQKIKLFTYDDGHGISKSKREAAVTWFRKWFYNDSTKVIEGELSTLPEKDLLCTKTGQVNSEFSNEVSIPQRNLRLFNELKTSRENFLKQDIKTIDKKIAALLSIDLAYIKIDIENPGDVKRDNVDFKKLIIRKKDEIPLPVLQLNSLKQKPDKIIIWLNEKGKNDLADSVSFLQSYHDKNYAVLLCDVSGTGETTDRPEFNDAKYYNKEYRNAMLGLHIGKPMVGIRTAGILTLMDFIASVPEYKNIPVEINATGITTISAMHAALFNKAITHLNLYGGIKTYKTILENPGEKNWYSYVINDVLKYYDLPDLVSITGRNKFQFITE